VSLQDNITLFLRGCEELGLKDTQLFDPSDLQDTSIRANIKGSDCCRKLKNVLITIYWLGKATNSCASYSGPTLNLKEFEGLLLQMRKEAEDMESPKRSIRDSGYIDCWDSERSDSLSPPRHGRDDSFDSLDSLGSRSQQTPSPDVVIRGSSDGRGSDSESDVPHRRMPDTRKDDMLARRTSCNEPRSAMPFNQYLPNKSNHSAYVPTPLRKKAAEREEYRKSWSTATSPIGGERPFRETQPFVKASITQSDLEKWERLKLSTDTSESQAQVQSPGPSEILTRRENLFLKPVQNDSEEEGQGGQVTVPNVQRDDLAKRRAQSGPAPYRETQPFVKASITQSDLEKWERLKLSTDTRSMSMIDMRCEEEAILQPHSKARYEHLHNLHNRLREEEDKWQDDLARWKNRRRSASQDLIKKEEERKKVERLMSGDRELSERRKSIKTYREIVEEKERREKELHEAYKNARSPEEAETILRRYTQRFTVSEAVLEGLEMPKFLQRSLSVDSDTPLSPTKEASNPMKYLRQQSLPAPKFTATVEATISVVPQPQVSPTQIYPTRTVSTKAVPILSPKPYSQPKNSQPGLRSFTVDGVVRVNGEAFSGAEDERESTSVKIPSTKSQGIESTARMNTAPVKSHTPQENTEVNTSLAKFHLESRVDACPVSFDGSPVRSPQQPGPDKSSVNSQKDTYEERAVQALETLTRSVESSVVTEQKDDDNENSPREGHMNCQSTVLLKTVQEKYQREQEKLKQEWERAQKEVEEEERRYHEEERKILEETVAPLTPRSSMLSSPSRSEQPLLPLDLGGPIVMSLADWERKQELLEKQAVRKMQTLKVSASQTCDIFSQTVPHPDASWDNKQPLMKQPEEVWRKTASLDRSWSQTAVTGGMKKSGSYENLGTTPSKSSSCSPNLQSQSPNRSISGKKLCSSCSHPLGKGAAMIIETLSLYFHIQCFKCGVCKGHLGDTTTGTDVRIRNGILNCNECYIRFRS
ncbi:LIMC1 protein, partial [Polyodon spathula]|nr:LIMC1 protein [Polyodon spathula]